MNGPLTLDEPYSNEYTLEKDAVTVWITVDNVSVRVRRTDHCRVAVDIFELGNEAEEPIAECCA